MATVILKVTEQCNSNCYYCDVTYKPGYKHSMSLEILEVVFQRINEYLISHPKETVKLIWHGGEPLILGAGYYRRAVWLLGAHCSETLPRINHVIQTNLTCFDQSFVGPFKSLGISGVGTSFDPEPHMRGPGSDIDSDITMRDS